MAASSGPHADQNTLNPKNGTVKAYWSIALRVKRSQEAASRILLTVAIMSRQRRVPIVQSRKTRDGSSCRGEVVVAFSSMSRACSPRPLPLLGQEACPTRWRELGVNGPHKRLGVNASSAKPLPPDLARHQDSAIALGDFGKGV